MDARTVVQYLVISWVALAIFLAIFNRENFTESFGFSGYKKPVNYVKLNDPRPDMSGYSQVESDANHDMVEKFVLMTNKELYKRLKFSTYIIETQAINKYESEQSTLYECIFTVVRNNGFAFGFTVVSTFEVSGNKTRISSLRSQPLSDQAPDNVKIYTKGSSGKEFVDYKLVKESAVPNVSELDLIKNKLS